MKKLFISAAIASVTTLSGCATMFQGTDDTVNVHALGAADDGISCTIKGGNNTWFANGKVDTVTVDRSSSDLLVQCKSDSQEGVATISSSFQAQWLVLDLLWDACIITLSCPIDAISGAFYDYPDNITVQMINLDGSVNRQYEVDLSKHEAKLAEEKAKKAEQSKQKQYGR